MMKSEKQAPLLFCHPKEDKEEKEKKKGKKLRNTHRPFTVWSDFSDDPLKSVRQRPVAQVMAKTCDLDTQDVLARNLQVRLPHPQ